MPDALRRYLTCDATVVPVIDLAGKPYVTGAARRGVNRAMRRHLEHRDGGCRAPGCAASRNLHVHHIIHWENGGRTITSNLVCLCPRHHRLHHLEKLFITGNADDPDGLTFTDHHRRVIPATGTPRPPGQPPTQAADDLRIRHKPYQHGSGERLRANDVWFGPPEEPPPITSP